MATGTLTRPGARELALMGVAVIGISLSGPLIVATAAPALAIAFWRCLLGSSVTGIWVAWRCRGELRGLSRGQWGLICLAGGFLAAHFATWVPSLRLTTVASSTALIATQPIWAALIARFRGARIPGSAWWGITVAIAGVVVLVGVDVRIDPRSLIGDALALAGAVFAALYVTVAERARRSTSTATVTFGLYGSAAAVLLVLCLALRQPLTGYSTNAWLLILALTVVAQLIGHTLFNTVLATVSATVVSLVILLEAPGSTIIAALALGQIPPLGVLPAIGLLFAGLVIVIRSSTAATPTESPPV